MHADTLKPSNTANHAANQTRNYFTLHGQVRMATLGNLYALDFRDFGEATLSDAIRRVQDQPVAGDCITLGPVELVVLDAGKDAVHRAGLRFPDAGVRPGRHPRRSGNVQRRWMNASVSVDHHLHGNHMHGNRNCKGAHERPAV